MFEGLKRHLRRKALDKWGSRKPTSLMPIGRVRSVALLMDVEDPGFRDYQDGIISWFRAQGIRTDVHFFDFRRLEKDELLITSIQNTVLKKDLNWFGMPDPAHVVDINADMFVSLVADDSYASRFYAVCCRSSYKVGRTAWEGHPYDLLICGEGNAATPEVFEELKKYLLKIC